MRALITGIGGFVGRHLARYLLSQGDEVCGIGRSGDCDGLDPAVRLYVADLRDRQAVEGAMRAAQPQAVYHLAAQSSAGESLQDPWPTLSNNLQAQMYLFESLLAAELQPRVLVVGSGDEYGHLRPEDVPTDENVPLRPTTPYGVSKVGQDVMAYQYFAQYGLPAIRVRPFNHTGPGHDDRFVIPSFARQLAEIEAGLREPTLRVGNLDVYRDFTDARDMVRAYRTAVVAATPGEVYNLGRGRAVRIGDVLDHLIGLCRVPVQVTTNPALLRPADVPRQEADIAKFQSLTGWRPEIPWEATLRDTLEDWRSRVVAATASPL